MKVNKRRDEFERKAIDLIFTASTNKFILPFSSETMFSFFSSSTLAPFVVARRSSQPLR
jgi:hypothetical protein